jgi:hypothetical protein
MPGTTIGASFRNGFAGSYARQPDMIIETFPASTAITFGDPLTLASDGTVALFGATGTLATFVGVASKEIKTVGTSYTNQNAGGSYAIGEPVATFERGAISVICNVGTPAPGGAVYVRIVANSSIPTGVVGGFEAAADSTNTIALTNCAWRTTKDASNVAELVIKGRNNA